MGPIGTVQGGCFKVCLFRDLGCLARLAWDGLEGVKHL